MGHVPRRISAGCSLFIQQNGRVTCEVSGPRQFSVDLPQGGLEVPCKLTFSGEVKLVEKLKKFMLPRDRSSSSSACFPLPVTVDQSSKEKPPSTNTITPKEETLESSSAMTETAITISLDGGGDDDDDDDGAFTSPLSSHWLSHAGLILTDQDHNIIVEGDLLNDKHINFAQTILKRQFPNLGGLVSTLQLSARRVTLIGITNVVQIIHTRCFGSLPHSHFNQCLMRQHLVQCFEKLSLSPFPICYE